MNPRSALRLARDSLIPSLDLILSSPKSSYDTPYPSPVSPSSPVITLREILLLSPSSHRKSRTRLTNRFEAAEAAAAAAARRSKTKGGEISLLGCASPKMKGGQNGVLVSGSPRNCRRSRRRSEAIVETKEDKESIVVLTDEKKQKPRKLKKTSRSKKEKQSLVPPLLPSPSPSPSSDLNEDVCQEDFKRIRENMNDLIMWRDVAKSTLWFGFGSICFLSSCFAKGFDFSVFSAISHLGLLVLGVSFLSNTLRERLSEEATRREFKLSEEDISRIARRMLPIAYLAISKASELFSGEPAMTLKVAPFVLIGAEYGYLITLWRLCAFGFFFSFTVPKLYSCYANQINQKVESAQKRIVETWGHCTHKKFMAGSMITAFWNLTSLKIRLFAVFIIVVVIRYRRQNLHQEEEEKHQEEQTHPEPQESPEEKSPSPSPPQSTEEEKSLVVFSEAEAPKKL